MFTGCPPIKAEPFSDVEYQPESSKHPIVLTPAVIKFEETAMDLSVQPVNSSGSCIEVPTIVPSTSFIAMEGTRSMSPDVASSDQHEPKLNNDEEFEGLDYVYDSESERSDDDDPAFAELPYYDYEAFPPNKVRINVRKSIVLIIYFIFLVML